MTANEFIKKWLPNDQKEISFAQSHFNDVCELLRHGTPSQLDPHGTFFTFEYAAKKLGGRKGRADVWLKDHFIWEYKGSEDDFEDAYKQLQLYRESLGNPPLLIVSDAHTIVINTNFTYSAKSSVAIKIEELKDPEKMELLKNAFTNPEYFKPLRTKENVTQDTANLFVKVVNDLKQWNKSDHEFSNHEQLAHFIIQLLFCLFAEDIKLLPDSLFSKALSVSGGISDDVVKRLESLLKIMQTGGDFGLDKVPFFDGTLFNTVFVPSSLPAVKELLTKAAALDWSSIDPTIFGTLFERVIDEKKRSQLGAHYTGINDIRLVIQPVITDDLRKAWSDIKNEATVLAETNKEGAYNKLNIFALHLSSIKILDPACGSGNFLYVALRSLLDLQKEVIVLAKQLDLKEIKLTVGPSQLFGLELDTYAHQLAQIVIWIGYIQWRFDNGLQTFEEPILKPLNQIIQMDSILGHNQKKEPLSPKWPNSDFIIGNPPFLGSRKMRPELGDTYCNQLLEVYKEKIHGMPDLVCYWFYKAQELVEQGVVKKVGLLATQAIRGGTNRLILDHIVNKGEIFNAWSDKEWMLDGAKVHISIVCFQKGQDDNKMLNGQPVISINSHLDSGVDLSHVQQLKENIGIAFQGVVLRGQFKLSKLEAETMLDDTNKSRLNNSDVIKKRKTGQDILDKSEDTFVIDFGNSMSLEQARQYETPFAYVKEHVLPLREMSKQESSKKTWWIHWNTRTQMKEAISQKTRFIATPRVAKHRVFVWLDKDVLPDAQLIVFARDDDYFFGVLHSRVHEVWARIKGTQLRDSVSGFRYTPKSVFRPFPMPVPTGKENMEDPMIKRISSIAYSLNEFRMKWMYPEGVGLVIAEKTYRKRTLTNLYNALEYYQKEIKGKVRDERRWDKKIDQKIISLDEIEELSRLHEELDKAVLESYGLKYLAKDDEILVKLMTLNQARPHAEADTSEEESE